MNREGKGGKNVWNGVKKIKKKRKEIWKGRVDKRRESKQKKKRVKDERGMEWKKWRRKGGEAIPKTRTLSVHKTFLTGLRERLGPWRSSRFANLTRRTLRLLLLDGAFLIYFLFYLHLILLHFKKIYRVFLCKCAFLPHSCSLISFGSVLSKSWRPCLHVYFFLHLCLFISFGQRPSDIRGQCMWIYLCLASCVRVCAACVQA